MLSSELVEKINAVKNLFNNKIVVVAYSGGVDSAVVGKLAQLYAKQAYLVTTHSLVTPPGELDIAKKVAKEIGLPHLIFEIDELENENFRKNPINRCYFCKTELSDVLFQVAKKYNADLIVDGTNYSDISGSDHRPGYQAIKEKGIVSPLVLAKITKKEVRELARYWKLSVAEKPSMACLSSRFPYGVELTPEKIKRVAQAELYLRQKLNIKILRVRDHDGLARIEVAPDERSKFFDPTIMDQVYEKFRELGFTYVTLDLKGYRSGALNEVLKKRPLILPLQKQSKPTIR